MTIITFFLIFDVYIHYRTLKDLCEFVLEDEKIEKVKWFKYGMLLPFLFLYVNFILSIVLFYLGTPALKMTGITTLNKKIRNKALLKRQLKVVLNL